MLIEYKKNNVVAISFTRKFIFYIHAHTHPHTHEHTHPNTHGWRTDTKMYTAVYSVLIKLHKFPCCN